MIGKETPAEKFMKRLSVISLIDQWAIDYPDAYPSLLDATVTLLEDFTPIGRKQIDRLSSNDRVHELKWGYREGLKNYFDERD